MTVNFEIIAFYPIKRNDEKQILRGSLHIYLVDQGFHLRGIYVAKKKDFCAIHLPYHKAQDKENVRYPVITFGDPEKQLAFVKSVREKGTAFIEEYLKNTPWESPIKEQPQEPIQQPKICEKAVINESKPLAKPATMQAIASKQWQDPPKRNKLIKKSSRSKVY